MRLADVTAIDPDITSEELAAACDDDNVFSLLVVAEAIRNRVPAGVTRWLSSPETCARWEDVLTVQEGNHQLSWWSKMVELGIEHDNTLRVDRQLARIRRRRVEAHRIVNARLSTPAQDPAAAAAIAALRADHWEEAEWITDRLRRSSGIEAEEAHTPKAAELLAMDDKAFRNLVANDVKKSVEADGLGHPAVLPRWYGALVELGTAAFTEIGINVADHHVADWFAVPDRHLIQVCDTASVDDWAPKLTFLTHVRAALVERARLRLQHQRRCAAGVDDPAAEYLIDKYSAQYDWYLQDAEGAQQPALSRRGDDSRPPHPALFDTCADLLQQYEWDTRWIFDGHRIWLDAWKGPRWQSDGRIIATAVRSRSTGRSAWRWGKPNFVVYSRKHRRYALLTGIDAIGPLAETNPKEVPVRFFKSVVPHAHDHLQALVPPDGYRWRHPFPEDLPEIHYR